MLVLIVTEKEGNRWFWDTWLPLDQARHSHFGSLTSLCWWLNSLIDSRTGAISPRPCFQSSHILHQTSPDGRPSRIWAAHSQMIGHSCMSWAQVHPHLAANSRSKADSHGSDIAALVLAWPYSTSLDQWLAEFGHQGYFGWLGLVTFRLYHC